MIPFPRAAVDVVLRLEVDAAEVERYAAAHAERYGRPPSDVALARLLATRTDRRTAA